MKDLQTNDTYVAPDLKFERSLRTVEGGAILHQLGDACQQNAKLHNAVTEYGHGDFDAGLDFFDRHVDNLLHGSTWKHHDNVFCVILNGLRHTGTSPEEEDEAAEEEDEECNSRKRCQYLLESLEQDLPRRYLHLKGIHVRLKVRSNWQKIDFDYWQQRLAGLTCFKAYIPTTTSFEKDTDLNSSDDCQLNLSFRNGAQPQKTKQKIRIFCGFDPVRAKEEEPGPCELFIYSSKSGRLIKRIEDARNSLGIPRTNDIDAYCQGLTIVVDDEEGSLPINPSKQDLSFGSNDCHKLFKNNFYAWVEGIAHTYYNHYLDESGKEVHNLRDRVKLSLESIRKLTATKAGLPELSTGNFDQLTNLDWGCRSHGARHSGTRKTVKRIRCSNRKKVTIESGSDTLVELPEVEGVNEEPPKSKKRKKPSSSQQKTSRKKQRGELPQVVSPEAQRRATSPPNDEQGNNEVNDVVEQPTSGRSRRLFTQGGQPIAAARRSSPRHVARKSASGVAGAGGNKEEDASGDIGNDDESALEKEQDVTAPVTDTLETLPETSGNAVAGVATNDEKEASGETAGDETINQAEVENQQDATAPVISVLAKSDGTEDTLAGESLAVLSDTNPRETIDELVGQVNEMRAKLRMLHQVVKHKDSQINASNEAMVELKAHVQDVKYERDGLQRTIEADRREMSRLRAALEQSRAENKTLKKNEKTLQTQVDIKLEGSALGRRRSRGSSAQETEEVEVVDLTTTDNDKTGVLFAEL